MKYTRDMQLPRVCAACKDYISDWESAPVDAEGNWYHAEHAPACEEIAVSEARDD